MLLINRFLCNVCLGLKVAIFAYNPLESRLVRAVCLYREIGTLDKGKG